MHQKTPPFHPPKTSQNRAFSGMVSIRSATDYSPFGVQLENRNFLKSGSLEYSRGFNGMLADDQIKGEGNSYDFGARMLDPRLGRWFSRDTEEIRKSSLSPYQTFQNNPIIFVDPDGNDEFFSIRINDQRTGKTYIIRGNEVISQNLRAGPIERNSNDKLSQTYHDYRTIVNVTIDQNGKATAMSISYHTLKRSIRAEIEIDLTLGVGLAHNEGAIVSTEITKDWDLEGNGGSQKGGFTFISDQGGASATKQRSLTSAEERNIEDLLTATGAGQRSPTIPDNDEKFQSIVDNLKEIIGENKGSDESIKKYSPTDPVIVLEKSESKSTSLGKKKCLKSEQSRKDAEQYNGKWSKGKDTLWVEPKK